MPLFFKYKWVHTFQEKIVDENIGVYHTYDNNINLFEMKKNVQTQYRKPGANITFPLIEEITQLEYEFFIGKPFN